MWTNIKCTFVHFIFLEKLIDSLEQNNNIKLLYVGENMTLMDKNVREHENKILSCTLYIMWFKIIWMYNVVSYLFKW